MIVSSLFLRRVLLLDAAASGATGLLLFAGGQALADITGLQPAFAGPVGLFLIGYALAVAWVGVRRTLHAGLVWAVVALNLAWTVESVLSVGGGHLDVTPLGLAFVIAQALAVAGFAALEIVGVRGSARLAA